VPLPDGRTLCGREARRYIRRQRRRQARAQDRLLGFTAARKHQARRILAGDETLKRLIGTRRHRPSQFGPWHPEGRFKAIGAAAAYDLAAPIEVDGVLPYVCQNGSLRHGRTRVRIRRVSRLYALVHFASRRVVQIDPSSRLPSSRLRAPEPEVLDFERLPGGATCPRRKH